jgi:hypothetical protein
MIELETVCLAERAVNGAPYGQKEDYLSTLGPALYRAVRFAEAIYRLEHGIQKRRSISPVSHVRSGAIRVPSHPSP